MYHFSAFQCEILIVIEHSFIHLIVNLSKQWAQINICATLKNILLPFHPKYFSDGLKV